MLYQPNFNRFILVIRGFSKMPAILLLALFATNTVSLAYAGEAADQVDVSGAYVRAVPPGQPNSAAFMALANQSDSDHALVAAESSVAEAVEMHSHTMEGGMMRMRRVERIDLGAGETVIFQPGELHVMLIGLTRQLEPGQQVDLTLIYEDGSRTQMAAQVQKISVEGVAHGKTGSCGSGRCGSGRCGGGK